MVQDGTPSPHLSQADVARLLQDPSPHARAEVAGKLAQDLDNPALTEHELAMAQDVVRLMARDVEASVRQALAQNLRRAAKLPHDVALKLAQDVEAVALPILEHSTVLTDDDLISVVKQGSATKQETIARRPDVSEQVADVLIAEADEKAVTVLMCNVTARIAETSLGKAVERFQASDAVKEAMVQRATLPATVAERLVKVVSDRLQDYLVQHHALSATVASDLVLQSRERSILNIAAGNAEQDIERLVAQMYHNKRLTPSLVLRALCMGDVMFFEAALAIMANVPLANARILIHDAGRLGLKTLYERAGMPANLLPVVRTALDVVHETEMTGEAHDLERYRARVIERILTQMSNFDAEDVDYLLGKLGDMLAVA